MLTPDQELESRANPEAPPCRCGHDAEIHFKGHERTWYCVSCDCQGYEPSGLEDILADEAKL